MGVDADLGAAIARTYEVFRRYAAPAKWEFAPGRPKDLLRRLTAKSLAELKCDDLGPYSLWAMTTVGDADAYRHFFPRILELTWAACPWPGCMPSAVANKLVYGGFTSWADEEREAIRAVFDAAWRASLARFHMDGEAEQWLCANLILGDQIEPRLEQWLESRFLTALVQLADAVCQETQPGEPRLFWEERPKSELARFEGWLQSGGVRTRLAGARALGIDESGLIERALKKLGEARLH